MQAVRFGILTDPHCRFGT